MTFHCELNSMQHCCGILEAGEFDGDYKEFAGDTPEELIEVILREAEGRPIIFNFVKKKNYKGVFNKEYEEAFLREAVRKHPKVMHLAKFINPGSNNRIDSYMIKDYKE